MTDVADAETSSFATRPDGHHLQEWQRKDFARLLAKLENPATLEDLQPFATPTGQIHLSVSPQLTELTELASKLFRPGRPAACLLMETDAIVRWHRVRGFGLAALLGIVATQTPLSPAYLLLLARALTSLNDDRALIDLGVVYGDALPNENAPLTTLIRRESESMLQSRMAFYASWARPFRYAECDPFVADPYDYLTFGDACRTFPWLTTGGSLLEAMRRVVDESHLNGAAYWEVVGGRLLGSMLSAAGASDQALEVHSNALRRAQDVGLDTEIGRLGRLVGNKLIKMNLRAQAVEVLQASAEVEAGPMLEYWAALSYARLGDAQRYLGDLPKANDSFDHARQLLEQHLTRQQVPLDIAVKLQVFRSFSASALRTAYAASDISKLAAQIAADGPRTVADLLSDLDALTCLPSDMAEAAAEVRATPYLSLSKLPTDPDPQLQVIRNTWEPLLRHSIARFWSSTGQNERHASDIWKEVETLLGSGVTILAIDCCENDSFFVARNTDAKVEYSRELTSLAIREIDDTFRQSSALATKHPKGPAVMMDAVDRMINYLQAAAGPTLDELLGGSSSDRIVFVPYLQAAGFPWHALNVNGQLLADRAVISYGESLDVIRRRLQQKYNASSNRRVFFLQNSSFSVWFENVLRRNAGDFQSELLVDPDKQAVFSLAPISGISSEASVHTGGDPLLGHVLQYFPSGNSLESSAPPAAATGGLPEVNATRDMIIVAPAEVVLDNPLQSRLLLGPNSNYLPAEEILSSLDLRGWRSVFLVGSETAVSRRHLLNENLGLAAAFLAAGVEYVIGSLWPVDALASAILLDTYCVALKESNDVPAALRSAQLKLRGMSKATALAWAEDNLDGATKSIVEDAMRTSTIEQPFSHPYYWGAFVVVGV